MKYQYHDWLKALAAHFNFVNAVQFGESKFSYEIGEVRHEIPIEQLPDSMQKEKSWFWYDLEIIVGEDLHKFRLTNENDATKLENSFKSYVKNWYREEARKEARKEARNMLPQINEAKRELISFLNAEQFIKKSHLKAFLKKVNRPNLNIKGKKEFFDEGELTAISKITRFFNNPNEILEIINTRFINKEIELHGKILNGLNDSQKIACIIDDDTNLVLAGAGTGKTKTLEVKTRYLIETGKYRPNEILLVAYGNKAKDELVKRVGKPTGVNAVTFHGFGRSIVEKHLNQRVIPDPMAEDDKLKRKFIDDEIVRLLDNDSHFVDLAIRYFEEFLYPYKNPFDFKSLGEYYEYIKANEIRALSGDKVKSYEEMAIANFLYKNGIKFKYEPRYDKEINFVGFTSYQPDFYLPDYDLYIEHYGVNADFIAPDYMNPKKYASDMQKKRRIHKKNKTDCIETYSFLKQEGKLLEYLESELNEREVQMNPIPKESYLDALKELGAVTKLADLAFKAIGLTRTMNHTIPSLRELVQQSATPTLVAAIDILEPLLEHYYTHLRVNNTADFETMINDAIPIIEQGYYRCPYKIIMVDEFQDISNPRADILKALQNYDPELVIFGVGDDWQGIYRFTGADLQLTYNFTDEFGDGTEKSLNETYRFNDKINDVASKFVKTNTSQKRRDFTAREVDDPRVHIVKTTEAEQQDKIVDVINWIAQNEKPGSILLLNRYKYKKPKYLSELQQLAKRLGLTLRFNSCHASKGKEAEYVIIMDMLRGKNGFPAEKLEHPLIEFLLPKLEEYPHAEERRIFYVALTRAKHQTFVISIEENCSEFVKQLRGYGSNLINQDAIAPSKLSLNVTELACPVCETGRLIRRGNGGVSSCSNKPYCTYKEFNCKACTSQRKLTDGAYVCQNKNCGKKTPACPVCCGELKPTRGRRGRYWGCYKGWDNCKGSLDWSVYKNDEKVIIPKKNQNR
ncbi:hypothetical protein A7985_25010 [Pseudoalteromonas luteoviolacea]|uniref:DNA 3'-5' helicase n=1 Tax=Pseudoalteromonas luteoviolacea TaxID=43657 RepID=A0A1C0TIP1_9GAMM|nr:UvrD-helicase domain-containing protein [Pseudoalteromonas luteoviolacea]OCQ17939.1 hypothetical protein A7985_25010 [Pseudoalteromonas luteoviolacea]